MLEADDKYLDLSIKSAKEAMNNGEAPFGAVIVKGDKVLAVGSNKTLSEGNPTMHAELVAIREASKTYGSDELVGTTLYCSCEPCMMCISAAFYSKVSRVVFAAKIEDAIKFGSGDPILKVSWLNRKGKLGLEIIEGGKREEVVQLFSEYVKMCGSLEGAPEE